MSTQKRTKFGKAVKHTAAGLAAGFATGLAAGLATGFFCDYG
jgi:hypothetical protein